MKKSIFLAIISFNMIATASSTAQSVEIQGEAKVTQMPTDNENDQIVVRQSDGTLATRSAQSLPASFQDTTRTLNTDFELAKHICDCGTNLPPYLIESLLDAGYSAQDLIQAGVPLSNIIENLPVYDLDGNAYDVITIGTQKWLKQNLRVTQYNDGTAIPAAISNSDWSQRISDEEAAYSYADGDATTEEVHGFIYSSYTTLPSYNGNREVCPTGWKTPSSTEVSTLISFLDPSGTNFANAAGLQLKEEGLDNWDAPNTGANNITGFTAVASGQRWQSGSYPFFGTRSSLLTESPIGSTAIFIGLMYNNDTPLLLTSLSPAFSGGSVRCLKE